jgi:DNA-binding LacI/PurR family transcriptional regulator
MITMTDIAHKAGVSRSAVSHVLNNRQGEQIRIPQPTRERILLVASEMGYRTNELARAVASGKTRMIGYLVEEPRYEPYWNTIIGALAETEELGFTLKVLSVTRDTLAERVRQCIALRLGGLIVRLNSDKKLIFEEAGNAQIPVVTIDEAVPQPFGIRVSADDAPGCHDAIEHLQALGHRRIGFISSGFPSLNQTAGDVGSMREACFRREMAARGLELPDGYVTYDSVSVYGPVAIDDASARLATAALLAHPTGRPSAIFCWRDETALFAIRECRSQGLRVPQDISIVGFSDLSAAHLFDPPLSTVKSPWDAMGRVAIQQLARAIEAPFDPAPTSHLLATEFVARGSSGPVSP